MTKYIGILLFFVSTCAAAEDYDNLEQQMREPDIIRTCEEQAVSVSEKLEPNAENGDNAQSQGYAEAYQNCLTNSTLSAN